MAIIVILLVPAVAFLSILTSAAFTQPQPKG
jgi:hypothetical protein